MIKWALIRLMNSRKTHYCSFNVRKMLVFPGLDLFVSVCELWLLLTECVQITNTPWQKKEMSHMISWCSCRPKFKQLLGYSEFNLCQSPFLPLNKFDLCVLFRWKRDLMHSQKQITLRVVLYLARKQSKCSSEIVSRNITVRLSLAYVSLASEPDPTQ